MRLKGDDGTKKLPDSECLDMHSVVNMLRTGFDDKKLSTLWVDKNLKMHGLIQAFSRTNRILNSVKTYGNIVCFRDLSRQVDEALGLFGDPNAGGIVLLKPYETYLKEYTDKLAALREGFPLAGDLSALGEEGEKELVAAFGQILRLRNILQSFDAFKADDPMGERELQDYQSHYLDIADKYRKKRQAELVSIADDLVFEMELVSQVDVNIDYILMLVEKLHGDNVDDKEISEKIRSSVASSPELRDKADLIEAFLRTVGFDESDEASDTRDKAAPDRHAEIQKRWREFVARSMEKEIDDAVVSQNLKPAETRGLISETFAVGEVPEQGVSVSRILKPVSRFAKGNPYGEKRRAALDFLWTFYDKYRSLTRHYPPEVEFDSGSKEDGS